MEGPVGSAPCLTAPADCGYEIHAAEIIYWGACPDCRAKTVQEKR